MQLKDIQEIVDVKQLLANLIVIPNGHSLVSLFTDNLQNESTNILIVIFPIPTFKAIVTPTVYYIAGIFSLLYPIYQIPPCLTGP